MRHIILTASVALYATILTGCTYLAVWDTPYGSGVYVRVGSALDIQYGAVTNSPFVWVRGAPDADLAGAVTEGVIDGIKTGGGAP